MTTKLEVLEYFRLHPEATSGQIARALGCGSAYVRTTLTRHGVRLKRSRPGSKLEPTRYVTAAMTERERCAQIAEKLGAQLVASAIRAGVTP